MSITPTETESIDVGILGSDIAKQATLQGGCMSRLLLYGDLAIQGFETLKILDLRVIKEVNEHATLKLTAVIRNEDENDYISQLQSTKSIKLLEKGEVTYSGLIHDASPYTVMSTRYLDIVSVSHTFLMDTEPISRSFQDKDMTYTAMLEEITGDYEQSGVMDKVSDGATIDHPIIQYNETDWQYKKRMASRFNSFLIPNLNGDGPEYYFGNPKVDKGELRSKNYTIIKNFSSYKRLKHGADVTELDFVTLKVETTKCHFESDDNPSVDASFHGADSLWKYCRAQSYRVCDRCQWFYEHQ